MTTRAWNRTATAAAGMHYASETSETRLLQAVDNLRYSRKLDPDDWFAARLAVVNGCRKAHNSR